MKAIDVVAAFAVCAALGAVIDEALDGGRLPAARPTNCVRDLWPEWNLERIALGADESAAYGAFGERWFQGRGLALRTAERCIAFVYDENVLWNPPLSLTVVVGGGKVTGRWLTKVAFDRPECQELPREVVELKGYFHAGACRPETW